MGRPTMVASSGKPPVPASLTDVGRFWAALSAAFHKAASSKSDLTVLIVETRDCSPARLENITELLLPLTRKDDTVFLPSPRCFVLILPRMASESAYVLSIQIVTLLHKNLPDTFFKLSSICFPEQVSTLEELEDKLHSFF